MQILYTSPVKAKRAFLLSGVSPVTLQNVSRIFCPNCGEGNLYSEVPCHGCGEVLPQRKAA